MPHLRWCFVLYILQGLYSSLLPSLFPCEVTLKTNKQTNKKEHAPSCTESFAFVACWELKRQGKAIFIADKTRLVTKQYSYIGLFWDEIKNTQTFSWIAAWMFRCIFQAVKINLNLLFLQSIGNRTYIDLFAKLRTPSSAHTYSVDVPLWSVRRTTGNLRSVHKS